MKVKNEKAAELVARQIRNSIVRGELADGDTLPAEAQLISTFEVSRPTIREAIRLLESENLISVSRGARGGARINPPTDDFVARSIGHALQMERATLGDIYEARSVIEPPAARLAAERRPKEAAAVLRAHVDGYAEILNNRPRVGAAVMQFHRLLVELSGNKTISLMAKSLFKISELHALMVYRRQDSLEARAVRTERTNLGIRSHQKLVDLIERGDGEAAEKHWQAHMKRASDYWLLGVADQSIDILQDF